MIASPEALIDSRLFTILDIHRERMKSAYEHTITHKGVTLTLTLTEFVEPVIIKVPFNAPDTRPPEPGLYQIDEGERNEDYYSTLHWNGVRWATVKVIWERIDGVAMSEQKAVGVIRAYLKPQNFAWRPLPDADFERIGAAGKVWR